MNRRRVVLLIVGMGAALIAAALSGGAGAPNAPSAITASITLNPEADAYVDAGNASKNFGATTTLRVDNTPIQRSYLRFDLSSLTGTLVSATLRIYPTSNQSTGYGVWAVADNTWSESAITYNNAPALGTQNPTSSGRVTSGTWTSVDVTSLISLGHKLSLALTTTSNTALKMSSRESVNKPQLVVQTTNTADTQPPTVPTGLTTSAPSPNEIDLSWTASTDDFGVAGYGIYRDGSVTPINTVPGSTLSYADTQGIAGGSTHSYTVDAFDSAGNHSAQSSPPVSQQTPSAPGCTTTVSPDGTYSATVCLTGPGAPGTVSGALPVTATVSTASLNGGTAPSAKARFCVDDTGCTTSTNGYALSDFQASAGVYSASLPTPGWVDGVHTVTARAWVASATWLSSPTPAVSMTFSNGVTQLPQNGNTFVPTSGTAPGPGQPLVVAAVGDGASGETPSSSDVVNLIAGWNPNLFLYLGDVYERGSPTEFANYYTPNSFFGRFRSVTDPTVGNHEYGLDASASGYFNFWDTNRHYFSFDAGGWHFISLDSTSQYNGNLVATTSPQYQWLRQDLAADTAPCTLVFYHHPVYNIGPEGQFPPPNDATRLAPIWTLLAGHGGVLVLNGHDHDYQRWQPLNANGQLDTAHGITEIISGSGGHGHQSGPTTDPRLAAWDFTHYGALQLQLFPTNAAFSFISTDGVTRDSGTIPCNPPAPDTTPPSTPTNLQASSTQPDKVSLIWDGSTDDVGVTGYDIYRDGSLLTSVGTQTNFADTTVTPNTSYSYVVRAHDAAGNQSADSNAAGVTTPGAAVPPLFSDDFESGTLSLWINTGLVTQQHDVYSGAWAVEAVSTSAGTSAYHTLSSTQTNLYYRLRFKVLSQAPTNNVYFLKIRTATGASILGLYRLPSGALALRNDAGATTITSSAPTTSLNTWYTLELHATINNTSSSTEVWLNGVKIVPLSVTLNLGITPIARVQIGDNTGGRTYDVALDDVVVDTSFIP